MDMPPLKCKKELQSFMGILSYHSNFYQQLLKHVKPLRKLTSVKTEWLWNRMYQDLYDKANNIINYRICI